MVRNVSVPVLQDTGAGGDAGGGVWSAMGGAHDLVLVFDRFGHETARVPKAVSDVADAAGAQTLRVLAQLATQRCDTQRCSPKRASDSSARSSAQGQQTFAALGLFASAFLLGGALVRYYLIGFHGEDKCVAPCRRRGTRPLDAVYNELAPARAPAGRTRSEEKREEDEYEVAKRDEYGIAL